MSWLSSIIIRTPSVPTADLTTLPQKLAFSGNDASAYGCPKNALCLGGGSGPIVGAGVDLAERCSSRDGGGRPPEFPAPRCCKAQSKSQLARDCTTMATKKASSR